MIQGIHFFKYILIFSLLVFLFQNCKTKNKLGNPEIVNVKSFGAKGDNKTDDYYAIKKAINFLTQNKKSKLFFPKGIYRVENKNDEYIFEFRQQSGIEVIGESMDETKIKGCIDGKKLCTAIFRLRDVDNISFKNITFSEKNL